LNAPLLLEVIQYVNLRVALFFWKNLVGAGVGVAVAVAAGVAVAVVEAKLMAKICMHLLGVRVSCIPIGDNLVQIKVLHRVLYMCHG
jgi:hypothetical protein